MPGKMAEHGIGQESSPGSPVAGQPPHGRDSKRYRLVEVAVGSGMELEGMGVLCARGDLAVLTDPLPAGGGERQRLSGGHSSRRPRCRTSVRQWTQ